MNRIDRPGELAPLLALRRHQPPDPPDVPLEKRLSRLDSNISDLGQSRQGTRLAIERGSDDFPVRCPRVMGDAGVMEQYRLFEGVLEVASRGEPLCPDTAATVMDGERAAEGGCVVVLSPRRNPQHPHLHRDGDLDQVIQRAGTLEEVGDRPQETDREGRGCAQTRSMRGVIVRADGEPTGRRQGSRRPHDQSERRVRFAARK